MGNEVSSEHQKLVPIWSWKSNKDPFSQHEEATWTNYPEDVMQNIEEAYTQNKATIEIGDYEIVFKLMMQRHKHKHHRQRPVRRAFGSRRSLIAPGSERFVGAVPNPKTVNSVFGGLYDFLVMLKRRSELLRKIFPDIHIDVNSANLTQVYAVVLNSILQEAKSIGDEKSIKEAQEIIKDIPLITSDTYSLFLEALVRSYTKETFLYRRVNKLLREEAWEELENLIPYVYFLAYAIMYRDSGNSKINGCKKKHKLRFNTAFNLVELREIIYVYRGACIETSLLSNYNVGTNRHFSWNAFTSTTKNIAITRNFLKNNRKAGYSSVIFTIQIERDRLNLLLDTSAFSVFPEEEEVILPPGTIFEFLRRTTQEDVEYIDLKMICSLDFEISSEQYIPLKVETLKTMITLEKVIALKESEVSLCNITDSDVETVISWLSQGKSFIKQISLTEVPLSARKMEELMECIASLEVINTLRLDIGIIGANTFWSLETAQIFAERLPKTKVQSLYLSASAFKKEVLQGMSLHTALQNIKNFELNFWDKVVDKDRSFIMSFVISQLYNTGITELSLRGPMNPSLGQDLGKFLTQSQVEILTLGVEIHDSVLQTLGPFLPLTKLKRLVVSGEKGTSVVMEAFSKILPNTSIETFKYTRDLKYWKNNSGLMPLLQCLSQSKLRILHLSVVENKDQSKFLQKLSEALETSSLAHLSLTGWDWPHDLKKMFLSLPRSKIESLVIGALNVEELESLMKILPQTKITVLALDFAKLWEEADRIIRILADNLQGTNVKIFMTFCKLESMLRQRFIDLKVKAELTTFGFKRINEVIDLQEEFSTLGQRCNV